MQLTIKCFIAGAISVVVGLLSVWRIDFGEITFLQVTGFFFSVIGSPLFVLGAIQRSRFRHYFGFWPPDNKGEKEVATGLVMAELTRRARHLHLACEEEERHRSWLKNTLVTPLASDENLRLLRRNIRWAHQMVQVEKRGFWRPYGVAKSFGFPIGKSYKDHLPQPEEQPATAAV